MTGRTLAIVVPIFNEERRLSTLLRRLEEADSAAAAAGLDLRQILLVDDGSTDGTAVILRNAPTFNGRLRVISSTRPNRGKGAAVRAGMLAVEADLALMTDVDLSTPLGELAALRTRMQADTTDIAIASRGLAESRITRAQPRHRELLGKSFNVLIRALTRLPYRDTQCGFKLFRTDTTRSLFELQHVDGFAFDVEILVLARKRGLSVVEVPVEWIDDPDTHVGIVSAPLQMAFDTLKIALRALRDD
jgi:dolichyl-phosphate beta-glucosyltransferase